MGCRYRKNECLVRKRKYDPKATVGFEPALSLGYAREAAIEFDGRWVLRANSENYTLETEEYPWVFWVDKDYYLQAQIGNDESTRVTLERFATCIHTCRGYKSEWYPEQDQGIILVFIKNEQAYYVQYQYNKTTQTYRWGEVIELDSSLTAVSYITVNRLNDYRVQITVKHATGIKTYISDRTYVNQAAPPEIYNSANMSQQILACYPKDYDINPVVTQQTIDMKSEEISDGTVCTLTFTINKILKFTGYNLEECITFNNSIPEYDEETGKKYVESITMQIVENSTLFTISLNLLPKKLVTEVYVNTPIDSKLIEKVGPYGYIQCPPITVQYDITVTKTTDIQKEQYSFGSLNKNGIEVKAIQTTYNSSIEEYTSGSLTSNGIEYKHLNTIRHSVQETYTAGTLSTDGIEYTHVGTEPI